nr:uncharacterized protein LOC127335510 [Lolium perenne]
MTSAADSSPPAPAPPPLRPRCPAHSPLRIRSTNATQRLADWKGGAGPWRRYRRRQRKPGGSSSRHAARSISSDEGTPVLVGIHLGSCRLTLPMMCDGREAVDAIRWSGGVRGRAGRPQGPTMALQGMPC